MKVKNIDDLIETYSTKFYDSNPNKNRPEFMKGLKTIRKEAEGFQKLDIDNYYNFYGVMTPKVDVYFLNENGTWIDIDNVKNENTGETKKVYNNNYFVSATIEDNGARKMTLTLFDRNFYSLQLLIFNAIKASGASTSFDKDTIDNNATKKSLNIKNQNGEKTTATLDFKISPDSVKNNLKIRWGYTDANPDRSETLRLTNPDYFNNFNGGKGSKSISRWNDRISENSTVPYENKKGEKNILTKGGYEDILSNQSNQTTIKSQEEEFFITDVKTVLTSTGIQYTINAVGTDSFILNAYKFVQMYATMQGTAKDLMAYFMNSFNNEEEKNSLIRICWNDSENITNGNEFVKDLFTGTYIRNDKGKSESKISESEKKLALLIKRNNLLINALSCIRINEGNTISEALYGKATHYTETLNQTNPTSVINIGKKEVFNFLKYFEKDFGNDFKKFAIFTDSLCKNLELYSKYDSDSNVSILKYDMQKFYLTAIYASGHNIHFKETIKEYSLNKEEEKCKSFNEEAELVFQNLNSLETMIRNTKNIKHNVEEMQNLFPILIGNTFAEKGLTDNSSGIFQSLILPLYNEATRVGNKEQFDKDINIKFQDLYQYLEELKSTIFFSKYKNDISCCLVKDQLCSSIGNTIVSFDNIYIDENLKLADYTYLIFKDIDDLRKNVEWEIEIAEGDINKLYNNIISVVKKENSWNGYSYTISNINTMISNGSYRKTFLEENNYVPSDIVSNLENMFDLFKAMAKQMEKDGKISYENSKNLIIKKFVFENKELKEDEANGRTIIEISEDYFKKVKTSTEIGYRNIKSFFFSKVIVNPAIDITCNIYSPQYLKTDNYSINSNDWYEDITYIWDEKLGKVSAKIKDMLNYYNKFLEKGKKETEKNIKKETNESNYNLVKDYLIKDIQETSEQNITPIYDDANYKDDLNFIYEMIKVVNEKNLNMKEWEEGTANTLRKKISDLEGEIKNAEQNVAFIKEQFLEKGIINLSLGGEEAKSNYDSNGAVKSNAKYYKSLSSLFNSYVGQCPPLVKYKEISNNDGEKLFIGDSEDGTQTYNTTDETGNIVTAQTEGISSSRRMTWNIVGKDKDGIPIVAFHYLKPFVPKFIRWYRWGSGNPLQHCVKNVNIETTSEFGMLNSAVVKNLDNGSSTYMDSDGTSINVNDYFFKGGFVNDVTSDSNETKGLIDAMVNGVKKGTIEILGDPSLRFQGSIQPGSYPIYLDIKLQKDGSWGENSGGLKCQMSGYYVINSITHNISANGYTTSLNVMSYPSLKNELTGIKS